MPPRPGQVDRVDLHADQRPLDLRGREDRRRGLRAEDRQGEATGRRGRLRRIPAAADPPPQAGPRPGRPAAPTTSSPRGHKSPPAPGAGTASGMPGRFDAASVATTSCHSCPPDRRRPRVPACNSADAPCRLTSAGSGVSRLNATESGTTEPPARLVPSNPSARRARPRSNPRGRRSTPISTARCRGGARCGPFQEARRAGTGTTCPATFIVTITTADVGASSRTLVRPFDPGAHGPRGHDPSGLAFEGPRSGLDTSTIRPFGRPRHLGQGRGRRRDARRSGGRPGVAGKGRDVRSRPRRSSGPVGPRRPRTRQRRRRPPARAARNASPQADQGDVAPSCAHADRLNPLGPRLTCRRRPRPCGLMTGRRAHGHLGS